LPIFGIFEEEIEPGISDKAASKKQKSHTKKEKKVQKREQELKQAKEKLAKSEDERKKQWYESWLVIIGILITIVLAFFGSTVFQIINLTNIVSDVRSELSSVNDRLTRIETYHDKEFSPPMHAHREDLDSFDTKDFPYYDIVP